MDQFPVLKADAECSRKPGSKGTHRQPNKPTSAGLRFAVAAFAARACHSFERTQVTYHKPLEDILTISNQQFLVKDVQSLPGKHQRKESCGVPKVIVHLARNADMPTAEATCKP
jgi:hypothetical protein